MKLKSLVLLIIIFASISTLFAQPKASAHVTASDGDMHVTLHIDPNDYPVINEPQTFVFIYEARSFDARNCKCTATIKSDGKQILRHVVPPVNAYYGRLNFTFRKPGVYQVLLSGQPKASQFQPFNLSYNIRVSATNRDGSPAPPAPPDWTDKLLTSGITAVIIVSLAACGYNIYNDSKRRR